VERFDGRTLAGIFWIVEKEKPIRCLSYAVHEVPGKHPCQCYAQYEWAYDVHGRFYLLVACYRL